MSDAPHLTRRATLAVATLAILATGCDVRNPMGTTDGGTAAKATVPHDVTVAVQAVDAITATQLAVTATLRRHPRLRPQLVQLLDMHKAHLAALDDAVPRTTKLAPTRAPYAVPPGAPAALRKVATLETDTRSTLVGLALRAQSGAFARLLASMSAAASQRLTELPNP